MAQESYVEHVLSSLSSQTREDLQAHLNHLDAILEQIDAVPSPEKEALLLELILKEGGTSTRYEPPQLSA
jgi:hypothetical protein